MTNRVDLKKSNFVNIIFTFLFQPVQRSPVPNLSQMSPLSLVTHNQHPAVTAANLMGTPHVPQDFEKRMMDYIKLFQAPKDPKRKSKLIKIVLVLNNFFFLKNRSSKS